MLDDDVADFTLVDLYTRETLDSTIERIANDMYLFKARPLCDRTWIHHWFFEHDQVNHLKLSDNEKHNMELRQMAYLLSLHINDSNDALGRWSPAMAYAVISIGACLSGDPYVALPTLMFSAVLSLVASQLAVPAWYAFTRPILLLPRVAYCSYVLWRVVVFVRLFGITATAILGWGLMAVTACVDFGADLTHFVSRRSWRRFKIFKVLPSQVFVVIQTGGGMRPDGAQAGTRYTLDQHMHILGVCDTRAKLLCDMQGLLVELEPLRREVVDGIWNDHIMLANADKKRQDVSLLQHRFVSLEVFNDEARNVEALDEKLLKIQRDKEFEKAQAGAETRRRSMQRETS